MTLFVGLGNPTDKYKYTRHNIGFMVIDALVNDLPSQDISKSQFKGELHKAGSLLLLKPMTYMNLSGESVRAVCDYYKPEHVVVVHDDLDLTFGSVRFKNGGSSGGHNGIKSIDAHIGPEYDRVRLGIGKPPSKGDVSNYVLQNFKEEEIECVKKIIVQAGRALKELRNESLDTVIKRYTSKKGLCQDD